MPCRLSVISHDEGSLRSLQQTGPTVLPSLVAILIALRLPVADPGFPRPGAMHENERNWTAPHPPPIATTVTGMSDLHLERRVIPFHTKCKVAGN